MSLGEVDLAMLIHRGEVVPFLGAFFTVQAASEVGARSPDWEEFVDALVRTSGHPPLGKAKSVFNTAYPELLQIVIDNVGTRQPADEVIGQLFGTAFPYEEIVRRSPLVAVVRRMAPPLVLTTNYDVLLERIWPDTPVFDLLTDKLPSILDYLVAGYEKAPGGSPPAAPLAIIKVHGTSLEVGTTAVTTRDYRRLFTDSDAVHALFEWIGQRFSLWFLGYSIRDVDIQSALLSLQSASPTRQHFAHKWKFRHPLEPRIDHLQFNLRSFEVHPGSLTQKIEEILQAAGGLARIRPDTLSIFRCDAGDLARACQLLSRFEMPEVSRLAEPLCDHWFGEIETRTDGWSSGVKGDEWARLLRVERVLRHLLFVAGRFDQRRTLARYVTERWEKVPRAFAADAAGTIAEGLCYVLPALDDRSIEYARALLDRARRRRTTVREQREVHLADALIQRTRARFAADPADARRLRTESIILSAQASAPELQAALLLDVSMKAVEKIVGGAEPDEEGRTAARAALELALFGGSYRRAFMALQRLAFLDPDRGIEWASQAATLRRQVRLPPEARADLYLHCAIAVALWRGRRARLARQMLAGYDTAWLTANALAQDLPFFAAVGDLIGS
ncbi:MAG TPA: SIR2 family protein [Longimicrobium sp.]